jgi:hypothetical protein
VCFQSKCVPFPFSSRSGCLFCCVVRTLFFVRYCMCPSRWERSRLRPMCPNKKEMCVYYCRVSRKGSATGFSHCQVGYRGFIYEEGFGG